MSRSRLQEPFLREVAASFHATQSRIQKRLAQALPNEIPNIIENELQGLYHGILVVFDGGTALANEGLISIVEEEGVEFERCLYERYLDYWPTNQE